MKLVLFGATGASGRIMLAQALERGHTVTAVARNCAALDVRHPRLTVRAGDVLDCASVTRAITDQEVVLWAVGASNVPSQRHLPSHVCMIGTQHILAAMQQHGVQRIISLSSWGVGDSMTRVPPHFRYIILPLVLRSELIDKAGQEDALRQSDREWTIVRPSRLSNAPARRHYRVAERLAFPWNAHLTRADLAEYILNELSEGQFLRKTVEISS